MLFLLSGRYFYQTMVRRFPEELNEDPESYGILIKEHIEGVQSLYTNVIQM